MLSQITTLPLFRPNDFAVRETIPILRTEVVQFQPTGEIVKRSLREALAESHVAAITIAALLLWAVDSLFHALWAPLPGVVVYLFTAIAIRDIPYFSYPLGAGERSTLILTTSYFLTTTVSLAAAWILSRWIYGLSPLRSLGQYRPRLSRRSNV